jgi:hypothetical protein
MIEGFRTSPKNIVWVFSIWVLRIQIENTQTIFFGENTGLPTVTS